MEEVSDMTQKQVKDLFGPWFNTLTEAEVKAFVAGQIMATAAHVHVDDVDAQTEVINRYVEVITSRGSPDEDELEGYLPGELEPPVGIERGITGFGA